MGWILSGLAIGVVLGQGRVIVGSNQDPFPREVVLRPEAVPYVLASAYWQVDRTNVVLLKEPAVSQRQVFRRMLRCGNDTNNAIAFIWDQSQKRLYLDLNRNLDLTDDPGGVFGSTNKGLSQLFANVNLPLKTAAGFLPATLDVRLSADGGEAAMQAQIHSRYLWQAKVALEGRDWQVAVADDLLSAEGPVAAKFLLVRPWAARTNRVSFYDTSSGIVRFPERIFWAGRAFRLERRFEPGDGTPVCKLGFTPQQPPLTEVRLSGECLDYALLSDINGYAVFLQGLPGLIKVPQGVYSVGAVWLKKGTANAVRLNDPPQVVNATGPSTLVLGGPLTNSVALERSGRKLLMNYRLVGADGASYRLVQQDRARPPEFTVYHDGKKVLSGKFQFG